jgi:LPS-assembly lipoprotein
MLSPRKNAFGFRLSAFGFKTESWKLTAASCLLLLAACGFHPMYGDDALNGSGTPMRGNIAIDPIAGRTGQILKMALEDRFNPESLNTRDAPYHLSINLQQSLIPAVVKSDGTIQRYDVHIDTSFRLFKVGTPGPVFTGALKRLGSYNVAVNANFATYEAEQDVIERTLQSLAEDYVLRISGYIAGKAPAKPS